MTTAKKIVIIACSNGVGKTTFAREPIVPTLQRGNAAPDAPASRVHTRIGSGVPCRRRTSMARSRSVMFKSFTAARLIELREAHQAKRPLARRRFAKRAHQRDREYHFGEQG